jgi:biopolymer transport protein ExbD
VVSSQQNVTVKSESNEAISLEFQVVRDCFAPLAITHCRHAILESIYTISKWDTGVNMKIKQSIKKPARIEMIPLIDVVFLLLVFFIYAMLSMVIHRGIPVNLPQAKSALTDKKDYISLSINWEGDVFFDKRRVSLKELKDLLIGNKEYDPDLKIFISGDRKTPYERVVEVLDVIRITGLSKVSLETEFENRL